MEPQRCERPNPNDTYISFLHDGSVTFRRSDSFALDPQGNWVVSFVETGPCTSTTVLTLKPATPVPLNQWMAFARKTNDKVASQVFQQCVAAGYLPAPGAAPAAGEVKDMVETLFQRVTALERAVDAVASNANDALVTQVQSVRADLEPVRRRLALLDQDLGTGVPKGTMQALAMLSERVAQLEDARVPMSATTPPVQAVPTPPRRNR